MTARRAYRLVPRLRTQAITLGLLLCSSSSCTQVYGPFIDYDVTDAAQAGDMAMLVPQAPVLNSVTPPLGPTTGGITLSLGGQNFAPGATVTIAGAPAMQVAVSSPTTISAILPPQPGAFGPVPVIVQNPGGLNANRGDLFAYYASAVSLGSSTANISVGMKPNSVAVGDFNGDGNLDLVTTASGSNSVYVLLGDGKGNFNPAAGSPITGFSTPYWVAVGDFNGDGNLDLVVANNSNSTVSVLSGNGKGGFGAATNLGVGSTPVCVTVADFNGDLKPDLAVSNAGTNNISILTGLGNGLFTTVTGSPFAAGAGPRQVVAGDFNGDKKLDLAVGNNGSNNVTVLLGTGTGTFTAAVGSPFAAGTNPIATALADFNGDQKLDIAVSNLNGSNVTVLLGDGSGGFQASPKSPQAVGSAPFSLVAADFNGDQKADLATANFNDSTIGIYLGDGMGGFNPIPANKYPMVTSPIALVVGDFNNDKKPDLAAALYNSSALSIQLNTSQ